jgi:hydrogenase maturation protease
MSATLPRVRLLVCGNVDRADDGAAIWATGHLLPNSTADDLPGIDVRHCGQLDVDDLTQGGGAPTLIVDTAIGIAAGRVVTLTFDELLAKASTAQPHSSHALPIDQVIGVARELSDGPVEGLFVGIGAAELGFGRSLSQPVRESMGEFVVAIQKALMCLTSMNLARAATRPSTDRQRVPATAESG